ncbi:hypothetical protein N0B51_02465 [Tsuneonella sp. YG55]|uniref:Uncharacterized protein n=1 Tax=Tsuneonella litorea TaxID=2976475 RepID=A0A9X3AK30_9SPHN|nr:hypothetical protein [Tsuneonella litorea]MCT2557839.1 hypothetical protein [Tsuneonella litorea]
MKKMVLAAAGMIAAPALAQSAPATDHAQHAGHAMHGDHAMHAGHAQAAAKFTLDTPIAAIAADEKGKAILEANLPGLTTHEHFEMFKGMSLNQLAPMAGDRMPAEALAKVKADFEALN